jgi:hypothetical protein
MKVKRRTEITIQVTRTAIVHRQGQSCGADADQVRWTYEAGGFTEDSRSHETKSRRPADVLARTALASCWRGPGEARGKRDKMLSQDAFDCLLDYLSPDRHRAGEAYEMIRAKLIKFFEARGCSLSTEYTDETINRVADNLQRGKQIWTEPPNYFLGVARNLLKEYWGGQEWSLSSLDAVPNHDFPCLDPLQEAARERELWAHEQRLECLNQCLEDLSAGSRDLLLRYYQGEGGEKIANRKRLAEELGIEVAALRLKTFRIRQTLEAQFKKLVDSIVEA